MQAARSSLQHGDFKTDFTLVVVPDTQHETKTTSINFSQRMQWIADNAASLNIKFMIQNGDLTDWDTSDHIHFERASAGLSILENTHNPYSLTVGNHDTAAVAVGGSAAPGDVHANLRITTTWNMYFPPTRLAQNGVFEAGKSDNGYRTFKAGGLKWLVINLEFMPRTTAIAWANTIVPAFPHHNVIISTHMFLNPDASIGQDNGGYGDNSPQYMWDNLIKLHSNIRFVFSGHLGTCAMNTFTGVNGNKVYAILDCWHQGSTNPTRLLSFDTVANTISTVVYEPLTDITKTEGVYSITNISWVR